MGKGWRSCLTGSLLACSTAIANTDLRVSTPGQSPDRSLRMKSTGVPAFSFVRGEKRVEQIPVLNVGVEPRLEHFSAKSSTPLPELRLPQVQKLPAIPSVDTRAILRGLNLQVGPARELVAILPSFRAPTVISLASEPEVKVNEPNPTLTEVKAPTVDELKILQAQIFMDYHRRYDLALGLLSEVVGGKQDVATDLHFLLGLASDGVGLHSEFLHHMRKVLRTNDETWQRAAVDALARQARSQDQWLVGEIDARAEALGFEVEQADQYLVNRARFYLEKNDLGRAEDALVNVSASSKLHPDAQFLRAILNYRAGRVDEALLMAESALELLKSQKPNSELRNIAALTLGRLQFQKGKYKEALETYRQVQSQNPLFPTAMTESAWSQIQNKDYEGAAGNMYSLHTDFFRNTFAPESYIVRTIGYLNLCQFGDGLKVLYSLNQRYKPMKESLKTYLAQSKDPMVIYDSIRKFFRDASARTIDGLHRNLFFELARHPSFIEPQSRINAYEEEIQRWKDISLDVVKLEREILARIQAAREEQAEVKKKDPESKSLADFEQQIWVLQLEYDIAKRARNAIRPVRENASARLAKEIDSTKVIAARALQARLREMAKVVDEILDQSEVLGFEIYSGAGEHLRFQAAGGKIDPKGQEEVKVTIREGRAVQWEYKGEVWQDEIGHFRSSVQNVCPPEEGGKQ